MIFICYRKSLIVTCVFYKARCLSHCYKSDFCVLISKSPLTAILKLILMKVTLLSGSWKAAVESLDWAVLIVCAALCTLNHENLDQPVKLNESSAKYQTQMQRSFGLCFKDGRFIKIKLNKTQQQQTPQLYQNQNKNKQTPPPQLKTLTHKNNPERQLCTLTPTDCCWFTVLQCSEVFLLIYTFVLP